MIKLKHFYKVIFLAVLMAAVPAAAISQDLAEGLVAHWTFDNDTGGKVFDFSGNRNHGTSYNVSYGDGPVGKAAVFNNAGASIHIPQKGMPPSHKIADLNYGSISLWFKYQSVGANILPILYFGESDDQSPHNSLIIEIGHSEDPRNRRLYFTIVNKQFCFDSRQNLEENKWYHFAAVVSPDGNTGYLNGELMSERNYNLGSDSTYTDFFSSVPAAEMLSIGYGRYGRNENFFTFKGSIDDVRIYNKPLRPDEVKNLYEMGEIDEGILPDFEDISYGPHERNLIDFWKADSDIPTPVVVFIHGGGFINGDKSSIRTSGRDLIRECLDTGISFAAINYRLRNTTTLDSILLDCSRSIQFLRFKAEEWNINKDRIAAYGGSAGGGASLWISASDDLADPNSEEAVLRESSRLTCAGHLTSQATYDIMKWADFLDIPEDWITEMNMRDHFDFYGIKDQSEINDPGVVEIRERVDMLRMIDKNDPPVYFQNLNPNTEPQNSGAVIHHPRHAFYLKQIYDDFGIDSELMLKDTPQEEIIELKEFFFRHLLAGPSKADERQIIEEINAAVYPNPIDESGKLFVAVPAEVKAEIKIYNLLGKEISEIYNGRLERGAHSFEINASDYPPGVYFYVLKANKETISGKVIIRK